MLKLTKIRDKVKGRKQPLMDKSTLPTRRKAYAKYASFAMLNLSLYSLKLTLK